MLSKVWKAFQCAIMTKQKNNHPQLYQFTWNMSFFAHKLQFSNDLFKLAQFLPLRFINITQCIWSPECLICFWQRFPHLALMSRFSLALLKKYLPICCSWKDCRTGPRISNQIRECWDEYFRFGFHVTKASLNFPSTRKSWTCDECQYYCRTSPIPPKHQETSQTWFAIDCGWGLG